VARDVIEDEPLAQREIAQRDLGGAEAAKKLVEQNRAGDGEVGAPRLEARSRRSMSSATTSFRTRRICFAAKRRLRSPALGGRPSAADATAPRLMMVPDVPMTRSKPTRAI